MKTGSVFDQITVFQTGLWLSYFKNGRPLVVGFKGYLELCRIW